MASMTSGLLLSENVMLDLCAKAVAATMLSREIRGRIINMSSNCGKLGYPRLAAYCASKFGMIGFTQALALELARRESPSTPICPGLADTDRLDHLGRRPDGSFDPALRQERIRERVATIPWAGWPAPRTWRRSPRSSFPTAPPTSPARR
jgi:NAD(P)-dependent dehydrogenase (short-subunit alcohol dehydrogenase family)